MYEAPPFFPSAETRLPPPPSSSSSSSPSLSNLSPSIIITLMVLSVAIIVTTCLCLLFRHLHRLPLPRCLLHRHLSTSSSSSSSSSPPLRASAPPPQDGAAVVHDESFIDSLPLFSFSSVTRRSSSAADGDCAVCLCKFKPHDLLRLLPLCCHAFHAECIDTWLQANRTCPLCRSNVHACEADLEALLQSSARIHAGGDVGGGGGGGGGSFRLEIGSVSRRRSSVDGGEAEARRSYSIGSFDYVVDADSEVAVAGDRHRRSVSDKEDGAAHLAASIAMDASLAADVASGRSWLGDYMDRLSATLSSRTASFRSSRRFFSGSSRRSDASAAGFVSDWDLEASRVGEEISELFRWASGV